MQATSIVQSLIPQQNTAPTVSLKEGQMIYGSVNKIYNNQTADISIGQSKFTAVLDAPIVVGEKYWFQVKSSGDMTTLKLIQTDGNTQSMKEMSQQLLQHFSQVQTKDSSALAQFFVKNQIPISKENFIQALQWMNENGNVTQTLNALKIMNDLSLPFTKDVFKGIASFENGVSLKSLISDVLKVLQNGKSETDLSLKAMLSHLLSTHLEKTAETGLHKLVSGWLSSQGQLKDKMFRILQNIGFFPKQASQANIIMQGLHLMSENNHLVRNPSVNQAMQLLSQLSKNDNNQNGEKIETVSNLAKLIADRLQAIGKNGSEGTMWKQIQQELSKSTTSTTTSISAQIKPDSVLSTTKKISATNVTPNVNSIVNMVKNLLAHISSTNNDIVRSQGTLQVLSQSGGGSVDYQTAKTNLANILMLSTDPNYGTKYTDWDLQLLQKVLFDEVQSLAAPQAAILSNDMKNVLRLFGLGFENYLSNLEHGAAIKENELLTLKPMLLKWLNENQFSSNRDSAEQLLHKITAQQILSQSSGPIQHALLQFPISFHRFQTEVVMQVSGRKKNDGEIDPAYCRVLFYLQLENINETVIDMVVQNRIMKIGIINENSKLIKVAAEPYIQQVKERLDEIGFQVSAISFELPHSANTSSIQIHRNSSLYDTSPYNGVDIKI